MCVSVCVSVLCVSCVCVCVSVCARVHVHVHMAGGGRRRQLTSCFRPLTSPSPAVGTKLDCRAVGEIRDSDVWGRRKQELIHQWENSKS